MVRPIIHLVLGTVHVLVWPLLRFSVEGVLRRQGAKPSYLGFEPTSVGLIKKLIRMCPHEGISMGIRIRLAREDEKPLFDGIEESELIFTKRGELKFDAETNKSLVSTMTRALAAAKSLTAKSLPKYKEQAAIAIVTPHTIWDELVRRLWEDEAAMAAFVSVPEEARERTGKEFVPEPQGDLDKAI